MKLRWSLTIIAFLIVLSFLTSIYFYPQMPDKLASHWNIRGEADGYTTRFWGLFLMPIISVVMTLLLIVTPKIDPLKRNVAEFKGTFYGFIALMVIFLFYLHLLTILWNLGKRFNMGQLLTPAFSILFYYCGGLVSKAKRNWFIGIRTPWTLSSDSVWDKTHAIGGRLFKLAGLISILGVIFPDIAFWLVIIPVLLFTVFSVVFSYILYQKETKAPKPV